MTDAVIDAETLAKTEQEIAKRQAEEFSKLSEAKAKEVEEKVRKEFSEKAEKEALAKKLSEQESLIRKMEEEQKKAVAEAEAKAKAATEVFEKRLQELEARRQGFVANQSPFEGQASTNNSSLYKGVDLTKEDEIWEATRLAFMEKHGIKDPKWGTPVNRE